MSYTKMEGPYEGQYEYIDAVFDFGSETMYSIWGWLTGAVEFLLPFLFKKKEARLVLLGLANAGKTTLLHRMKYGRMIAAKPTPVPLSEEFQFGKISFITYDLGGHDTARRIWNNYYPSADAILFLIDSSDREQFPVAKAELDGLLSDEQIRDVPIAILVNKTELPATANAKEIAYKFDLEKLISGKNNTTLDKLQGKRPLEIFQTSVLQQYGYQDGLAWLANFIN